MTKKSLPRTSQLNTIYKLLRSHIRGATREGDKPQSEIARKELLRRGKHA